ncbi:mycofactocin-coupled SDR family oxidoreductase [Pseudonocardia acaciae]|uniref:mycofactocin-coupled SDR family oxidoreductase n=1 Tax=Pseudonocardia acaciae TaxID=551276 RepID=UPI00048AD192|nr:mycofactocin-coupled SDR family oxidoreductase [Pseudonocardia acaciae]
MSGAGFRVALVTGAARGIGAAVVHRLAADGWRVVAVDACAGTDVEPVVGYPLATRDELDAVVAAHPDTVRPMVADVRDQPAMLHAVRLAEEEFGGLDAAVAAAAVMIGGRPLWEVADAEWDTIYQVGLRGVLHLARAAVPALLARPEPRSGRFVALTSAAAHRGLWHLAPYCAVKHGVLGLVRGLAADLRGTGVSATAVSPGSTDTAMLAATAEVYGLDSPERFAGQQLVERLLSADEVAASVCWLCSAESSAVMGTVVHADGGFVG